jgi:translation initiation factor 3 subunit G
VSNLPEETDEQDLRDLFNRYGRITRIYLARDKTNNTSKGFAFVTFDEKRAGQIAMDCVNGFGYGHLILQIEWAAR